MKRIYKYIFLCATCLIILLSSGCSQTGYTVHTIQFPANDRISGMRADQCNDAKYPQVEPFTLSISLPEKWTLETPTDEEMGYVGFIFSPINISNGKDIVGTVAYNAFSVYEDASKKDEENYYVMVYSDLMIGSLVSWDNDYTPVSQTETSCTATCRVSFIIPEEGKSTAEIEPFYHNAILSYNLDKMVYIAIEFSTEEPYKTIETIAKSIKLL